METTLKKKNVIIDTDPGVDDAAAITLSLYDNVIDIKLITTVSGNLGVDVVTRNILHVLEKFNRTDIPVAVGASKPLFREPKTATFIHKSAGLGGYIPPEKVKTKPIKQDAVEAMYDVIKQYPNDINIIAIGPHTNLAKLIQTHPDVKNLISHIYTEGASPYYMRNQGRWSKHISFNASSDPEAVSIVINSNIPITYVPSRIGREYAHFTEKDVMKMAKINNTGKFIHDMYSDYWEPGYQDKRVATNDTCAVLALRNPKLFKTKKVHMEVNTMSAPGRTIILPSKDGEINCVFGIHRRKMHKYFFNAIKKMSQFDKKSTE